MTLLRIKDSLCLGQPYGELYLQTSTKVNQVKTDPHSPGEYRAFAPLVNVDAFHNAFDIKPGDKLYKKPEDRIKIW